MLYSLVELATTSGEHASHAKILIDNALIDDLACLTYPNEVTFSPSSQIANLLTLCPILRYLRNQLREQRLGRTPWQQILEKTYREIPLHQNT